MPIDGAVADRWAGLVATLRQAGRRAPVNDVWIAATAAVLDVPVVTQDDDYAAMPGVAVLRV